MAISSMTVYTLVAMHSWLGLRLRGISPLVCVLASSAVVQRKIEQCGAHLMTPLLQNTDAILQLGHLIFESFDITFICFHVQHKTLNCLSNQMTPRMQPLHRLSTDKLARAIGRSGWFGDLWLCEWWPCMLAVMLMDSECWGTWCCQHLMNDTLCVDGRQWR